METGIVALAFTPVRQEPSEQSGQVTQLLFGELCEVLDKKDNWYHIRARFDNYEGWCDQKMIDILAKKTYNDLIKTDPFILSDPIMTIINSDDGSKQVIPAGSSAWQFREEDNSFINGDNTFRFEHKPELINKNEISKSIGTIARGFLNTPYLWGGKSTFGCDCSGLVQTIFRIFGIFLPRDSAGQVNSGNNLPFLYDSEPGDLAFFDNEEGEIIHVGIILNNSRIIHASGKVRIDSIDQEGIFNSELGKYTHRLRTIKRVL